MKKYSFLIFHQDYDQFLANVRELGVLHVVLKESGFSEDASFTTRLDEINKVKAYLKELTGLATKEKKTEDPSFSSSNFEVKYHQLSKRRDEANQTHQILTKEIGLMDPWGEFDYEMLHKAESTGYKISFFVTQLQQYNESWAKEFGAIKISKVGTTIYFVTVTPQDLELTIEAERAKLSPHSLSKLHHKLEVNQALTQQIQSDWKQLAEGSINGLERYLNELNGVLSLTQIHLSTKSVVGDQLMLLEGWVPVDRESELDLYLGATDVYSSKEKATEKDNPPVLMKNNAYAKLFEPITKIFSLPNYHELDLTPFLAPFFMLFFGFCTGDAGYGLLILLAATFAKFKLSKDMKPLLTLAQFLGLAAVVFGMLSGTFFGVVLGELSLFVSFKQYFLNSDNLMMLSIALGAIQVLFGMILNAIKITKQKGWKYGLYKIGWVLVFIFAGAAIGLPMAGVELSETSTYGLYGVAGIGAALALLYNNPDKNILVNIGGGLWETYGMATGIVGDLLSYIRLFALGLTGGVLGGVFNQLAFTMSPDIPVVKQLMVVAILLIGHGITLALTILGALIHPMRLSFVEFYKNAGFEGGGKAYTPFKKQHSS